MNILLAEFSRGDLLRDAARAARQAGYGLVDAFTPFPIEGVVEELNPKPSHIRVTMFIGGVGVAALAYGLEWYSAVLDYPINSGGRPLHSWPTFVLFPFAIGILAAAVSGLIALLVQSGLPRLHHPLFAVSGFALASQDAFLLAVQSPQSENDLQRARDWLRGAGAVAIWEVNQ
jgi:hypothetical protein